MEKLCERGIEEFNRQEFFEAHDTWEELWMETRGARRLFYQGLIQTAVGFYHLENGNYKGAGSQLGKAVTKLEKYLPVFDGVQTHQLLEHLRMAQRAVGELQEGSITRIDESLIPRIVLIARENDS